MKRQYTCSWPGCGNKFEKDVRRYSKVQCKQCGQYLKTWDDSEPKVILPEIPIPTNNG